MFEYIECKAFFKQCNIQAGKTVLQFELDPHYMGELPMLARLAGHTVSLRVESEQQVIVVNRGTGEIAEGQASIYDDEEPEEVKEDAEEPEDQEPAPDYEDVGGEDSYDEAYFALLDAGA